MSQRTARKQNTKHLYDSGTKPARLLVTDSDAETMKELLRVRVESNGKGHSIWLARKHVAELICALSAALAKTPR